MSDLLKAPAAAPAHTDHPLRHWDRTCPACLAEPAGGMPEEVIEIDKNGKVHPAKCGYCGRELLPFSLAGGISEKPRTLEDARTEIKGCDDSEWANRRSYLTVGRRSTDRPKEQAEARVMRLEVAIQQVLDDEESRPGAWGPDVTSVGILREALAARGEKEKRT